MSYVTDTGVPYTVRVTGSLPAKYKKMVYHVKKGVWDIDGIPKDYIPLAAQYCIAQKSTKSTKYIAKYENGFVYVSRYPTLSERAVETIEGIEKKDYFSAVANICWYPRVREQLVRWFDATSFDTDIVADKILQIVSDYGAMSEIAEYKNLKTPVCKRDIVRNLMISGVRFVGSICKNYYVFENYRGKEFYPNFKIVRPEDVLEDLMANLDASI